MKTFIINIKNNLINILLCTFIISLLVFSKGNIIAAKQGLNLWVNSVVPSLFPFFVSIELLSYTSIPLFLGKCLNKFIKPLFNVPGIGAYIFIMGLISGYPTGAKLIAKYRNQSILTREESERLLTFTNNSGMLFIIGTVGITLFQNNTIGILLLITHILSCITVGLIFRFWKREKNSYTKNNLFIETNEKNSNPLYTSIVKAINTCLIIGGFIVLFNIIISILDSLNILKLFSNVITPLTTALNINNKFNISIISGLFEITNGISSISSIPNKFLSTNIIITAFLLGFGGISVILQIYTVIENTDISIIPYIIGKILQGTIASIYTYILIKFVPIFNFDILPVFSSNSQFYKLNYNNYIHIIICAFFIICFIIYTKKIIISSKQKHILKLRR